MRITTINILSSSMKKIDFTVLLSWPVLKLYVFKLKKPDDLLIGTMSYLVNFSLGLGHSQNVSRCQEELIDNPNICYIIIAQMNCVMMFGMLHKVHVIISKFDELVKIRCLA